jgi:hypothetical protein
MNTALFTYGVLALLAIGASAALLRAVKKTGIVALLAATIAATVFQLIVYVQLGYLDPFAPVAIIVSWGYSFAVALVFTWGVRKYKPARPPETPQSG